MDIENKSTTKEGLIIGFSIAGILAIIFVVASTIGGELHSPFKAWLAGTFHHHWVGKGILSSLLFFVVGIPLGFALRNKKGAVPFLLACMWISILGALAIFGFFVYEFFAHA